ncbi:hypothetical protein [Streptomyces sp. NPDC090994]|uniref:hypothetical protein n=1 Tax=Streptomyces sp. NPDC090994 TaxID=3365969 RepID=UPI00381D81C6
MRSASGRRFGRRAVTSTAPAAAAPPVVRMSTPHPYAADGVLCGARTGPTGATTRSARGGDTLRGAGDRTRGPGVRRTRGPQIPKAPAGPAAARPTTGDGTPDAAPVRAEHGLSAPSGR